MRLVRLVLAIATSALLMSCAAVPTLQGEPEDVGARIGVNAVDYNQAYGHGIADQILLNVLRARDRLPLYYLSMSGINVQSTIQENHQFGIGTIGFGHGNPNWGIGSFQEQRNNVTSPGYQLNPFGPYKD